MDLKAFTLRMPVDVYRQVKSRKGRSVTSYVIQAVEEKLQRERDEELALGFAQLAGEIDSETEMWMAAQREAMKHMDG